MSEITDIRNRLEKIEARNRRVELDKSWETSFLRRLLILIFTYILIGIYLNLIKVDQAWLNAFISSLGFLISTLTISWIKNWWIKSQKTSS